MTAAFKLGNTVQYFDKFGKCHDNFEMAPTEPQSAIETCRGQSVCNIAPAKVSVRRKFNNLCEIISPITLMLISQV